MGEIIDGKGIAKKIRREVAIEVETFRKNTGIHPALAVVLVGDDPGSQIYVRNKKRACEDCGIKSVQHFLPRETAQDELMSLVDFLNRDKSIHGILVQVPLPTGLDEGKVLLAIDPAKDVDGFHPMNIGKFMTVKKFGDIVKMNLFLPCTPAGCIELLDRAGVGLDGANAVVIGRSNIVGKPVALLLMSKNATVTVCHSRTKNLPEIVRSADVVVAAIGSPKFVKGDWIKQGAAVIDVGMNRLAEGLFGDVDFETAMPRASYITPVPGGVGPMTIAMLMRNTIKAAMNTVK